MSRTGYIKLHRSFLEWEWHNNPNVVTIWMHLLLSARYLPGEYRGRLLLPGQLITGREKLARETGLSPDQVRTALKNLQRSGAIQIEPSNRYSVVTVVNWERYQNSEGYTPAGYPAECNARMQEYQGVQEYEESDIPNGTPDKSPTIPQQIPSENPNKSPHKKNDKKEEGEKEEETTIMGDRPFDLSSEELQLIRKRDEAIEAAARSNGIPFHEAGMLMARELVESYGLDALLEAISIAGRGKAQTWAYVEGILRKKQTKRPAASASQTAPSTWDVNPYKKDYEAFKAAELPKQPASTWDVNPLAEYLGARR